MHDPLRPADLPGRLRELRRRAGASVVAGTFEQAAWLGSKARRARPEQYGVTVTRDLAYLPTGLSAHTLDVYRPADAAGLPVVLYLHGGAFSWLSKDTHWLMGLAYARRGFVVAVPNYRLAPAHRFPAHLEDVAEALRYVVAHAAEWGGDPTRIVLAGESAGANLATSLAFCIAYERDEPYARVVRELGVQPLAVMAACGIFEVTNGARFREKYGFGWFLDDRYRELALLYAPWKDGAPVAHDLLNPLLLVERQAPPQALPPFFLPVGGRDHLKDDHRRMEAALRAHGADVEAPVYPGGIHAFHAFVFQEVAKACWRDHWTFLERRGVPVRSEVRGW